MEIQKIKYLENEKRFLDEIKNIFQFLKGYHLVINKNLLRIAVTSFNKRVNKLLQLNFWQNLNKYKGSVI